MNRTKRIENILKKNLPVLNIKVIDNSYAHAGHNNFTGKNETHIVLEILNYSKLDINRLETHKKINSLLKDEFSQGLHSLQIKTI
tara:strand:- start:8366 stop:8620 length:255 start_codon:yes stop_codon:yes gene_type:complete